ncbi:hypothetical protein ZIOFF_050853 [Zingiber officinale]|uniref:Cytokinin riboside 5'-monophosphate phosphoribohydrolase n=1 Tax=Zingiber officinale TaxID=94328 RepID=A0A8J5FLS3_ZINOF|nr:hypothetical protein ZIOFF_050853 [Zingiber officinale]
MVVSSASLPRARGFPRSEPSILGLTQGSCCRPCWLTMPRRRGKVVALALQSDHFLLSERSSPGEVKKEMNSCYELVNKLGRGVVYLGSSRLKEVKDAAVIALLLDCTTWSGAGPGLMDAAVKGALQVNKPVGGFKIARESGEWTSSKIHPYLPPESYFTCRFFSARKHGLVEAAVRNNPSDMTAIVAFPGGIGTLDELFEMLALIQLERIGSKFQVPFLLMNYDSFYSKLLEFLDDCRKWGTVSSGEVESLWKVCSGNHEALDYLAATYFLHCIQRCSSATGSLVRVTISKEGMWNEVCLRWLPTISRQRSVKVFWLVDDASVAFVAGDRVRRGAWRAWLE